MMKIREMLIAIGMGLALVAMAVPATAKKDSPQQSKRNFELRYAPTESSDETISLTGMGSLRACVRPPVDPRPDPGLIGSNTEEDDEAPLPIRTSSSVAEFLQAAFDKELLEMGFPVGSCETANRFFEVEVVQFEVVLGGTYRGNVKVRVRIKNQAGDELFAALASGHSTRFSMKESAENYLEVLSDSTFDAIHSLGKTEGFTEALRD